MIKQVDDRIWLVSFMHYDLGHFDDEMCRLEPINNPFEPTVLPMRSAEYGVTYLSGRASIFRMRRMVERPTRCARFLRVAARRKTVIGNGEYCLRQQTDDRQMPTGCFASIPKISGGMRGALQVWQGRSGSTLAARGRVTSDRRRGLIIFLLALAARLTFLWLGPWQDVRRAVEPDSGLYLQLADNLQRHHEFGLATQESFLKTIARLRASNGTWPAPDAHGLRPESFRTPGYPAFVAALTAGFGDRRAVLLAQCLLGAVCAVATFVIAKAFGCSSGGATVAGILWALHPALVYRDSVFMTESLFNACVVAALFLSVRVESTARAAGAGLMVGCAALVRPLGLFYVPATLALAIRSGARKSMLGVIVVAALVQPALWAARNAVVGEGFRTSTAGEVTQLFSFAAYTISEERREDWLATWLTRVDELGTKLEHRLRPGEDVFSAARTLAIEELRARPAATARVLAKSELKLMVDHSTGGAAAALGLKYEPSGFFSRFVLREQTATRVRTSRAEAIVPVAWILVNIAICGVAAWSLFKAARRRDLPVLIGCGLTIVLFAIATMSNGIERFRMPIMLPLFVLVGLSGARDEDPRVCADDVVCSVEQQPGTRRGPSVG